jgi:hypothetical protein
MQKLLVITNPLTSIWSMYFSADMIFQSLWFISFIHDANKEATESRVPSRYAEVATKTLLTV